MRALCSCILTGAERLHFHKNYSYYTISNRRNQLLFATFLFQIANSFVCTNSFISSGPFLGISYNSIFFDRIPAVFFKKSDPFPSPFTTVSSRHSFRFPSICRSNPSPEVFCFRCVCNRPHSLLHFAIFAGSSFIIFATGGERDAAAPHLLHFGGFSAGNPSVQQSRCSSPGAQYSISPPPQREGFVNFMFLCLQSPGFSVIIQANKGCFLNFFCHTTPWNAAPRRSIHYNIKEHSHVSL